MSTAVRFDSVSFSNDISEIGEDPVYVPDEETQSDYTIDDREVIRLYLQYQRDILKKFFN